MTRIRGSVPEGRTLTRPRPASRLAASSMAALSLGSSMTRALSSTRTLRRTWGYMGSRSYHSERSPPRRFRAFRVRRAERSPSPVVWWRRKMTWPEGSPPR